MYKAKLMPNLARTANLCISIQKVLWLLIIKSSLSDFIGELRYLVSIVKLYKRYKIIQIIGYGYWVTLDLAFNLLVQSFEIVQY